VHGRIGRRSGRVSSDHEAVFMNRLLTVNAAAAALSVSVRYLQRLIARGQLRVYASGARFGSLRRNWNACATS
jgi:excisionase family DNA binding protein